jgi:hypothetical protein
MPIIFRTSKIGIEQDVRNIPENYTALLMHYFDCVCTVLDLGFIQYNLQKIRSYTNYYNLTDGEKKTLFMLCGLFSVDVLKDKCIIENGEICGDEQAVFFSLNSIKTIVDPIKYLEIEDLEIQVKQVMFYKDSWIEKFYTKPMQYSNELYSHVHDHRKPETDIESYIVQTLSPPPPLPPREHNKDFSPRPWLLKIKTTTFTEETRVRRIREMIKVKQRQTCCTCSIL